MFGVISSISACIVQQFGWVGDPVLKLTLNGFCEKTPWKVTLPLVTQASPIVLIALTDVPF